jgi:hypothetical protein
MICHFSPRMADDFRASRLKSAILGMDRLIPCIGADCEFQSVGQYSRHAKFPHAVSHLFSGLVYGSFAGLVSAGNN